MIPLSYSVDQELLYKSMIVSSDTSRRTTVAGLHHERCGSSVSVTPATLLGIMCIMPNRSAQTLLPIIQQHVFSGTVIYSDEWAAYRRVEQLQPVSSHSTINHSLHLTRPQEFTHKTSSPIGLV